MKHEPPTQQMRVKTNTESLEHGTRSGHHWACNKSNTTSANNGAGITYPS
jgi:hypothetical protein